MYQGGGQGPCATRLRRSDPACRLLSPALPRARETCIRTLRAAPLRGKGGAMSKANRDNLGNYRSEEHTSELQSLMRISYAVFCLKKKKQYTAQITTLT